MEKSAKIKEELRLLSVVTDWLNYNEKHVNTPAFGDLTQAFARQQLPSIQRVITDYITRDASIENCVQNLNLSSDDGLQTIAGDYLWRQHGLQNLSQAFGFFGRVVKFQAEGKTSMKRVMQ